MRTSQSNLDPLSVRPFTRKACRLRHGFREVRAQAIGANTVGELGLGVMFYEGLDLLPITLVIANSFTVGADWQKAAQCFDVRRRGSQVRRYSAQPNLADDQPGQGF